MPGRPSVLLTTEGTYPFHKGGVSTWCDVLTWQLPENHFTLCAVTMHPYLTKHTPAPHVNVLQVPLWGIEQPCEYALRFSLSHFVQARWESTEEVITTRFVPLFDRFLSIVLGESSDGDIGILGNTLLAMHTFFEQYDYQVTVTSRPVWRCFHQRVAENWPSWPEGGRGTIDELTEALRLLFRFLQVLQFPVLPTTLTHSTAAGSADCPASSPS